MCGSDRSVYKHPAPVESASEMKYLGKTTLKEGDLFVFMVSEVSVYGCLVLPVILGL
jgi:hypothetical protein